MKKFKVGDKIRVKHLSPTVKTIKSICACGVCSHKNPYYNLSDGTQERAGSLILVATKNLSPIKSETDWLDRI